MANTLEEAMNVKKSLYAIRHDIHQHAESGLELPWTVQRITYELQKLDIPYDVIPGGIKAVLGQAAGKRILLRADMDALPIKEKTGLAYASQTGSMHACGHDLHATMLLGAAWLLKQHELKLQGQVIMMFQAGEETADGAAAMIQAGILDPLPDFAVAMHIAGVEAYPSGIVLVNDGAVFASRDEFTVTVTGSGGHGAEPHKARNPIYCAVKMISSLSDLMQNELNAEKPSVLSVCQIEAGTTANIIPEICKFRGTLRMIDDHMRQDTLNRFRQIVEGTAAAYGVIGMLSVDSSLPMLVNDETYSQKVYEWLHEGLDGLIVAPMDSHFSMGSEDFSLVSAQVPCVYLYVLSQSPPGQHYPEHNDKVVFDDHAIPYGSAVYAHIALKYLS